METDKKQHLLKVIEQMRGVIDNLTVTTLQVQDAINRCHLPQWLKACLLWVAAKTLRNRGVFSFMNAYLLIGASFIVSRPSIWEAIISNIFENNDKTGQFLLTIIRFLDGTIDYVVFWALTIVALVVFICHTIIKIQESKVRKELNTLIDELTFNPEKDWFEKKCTLAIKTLGNRYSSENNFKNPRLSNIYKMLITPDVWALDFKKSLQEFVKTGRHLYNRLSTNAKQENGDLDTKLAEIIDIYNSHQFDRLNILFDDANIILERFYSISEKDSMESFEIDLLQDSFRKIEDNTSVYEFFSNPVLYVTGDAGSGKSHFLADIVSTRMKHNLKSLFALGLDFNQVGDVRKRLMEIWNIKGTWDDFLNKLNKIGEIESHRILIIIDGINEGLGNQLWPNALAGIEADILQYHNLGLVVSARTFSKTNMLDGISKGKATINMEGFLGMEDEAITYLTGKFGLTLPQISIYRKEFSNPLFLKLYCQAYNGIDAPAPKSFLDIVRNYLRKVNEKLASKYDYQATLYNYTEKISDALTELYVSQTGEYMVKNVKFDELLAKAETILPHDYAHKYLEDLVSEGVLMSYINNQGEILVDFNFDLVGDYIYAAALIERQWKKYMGKIYDKGIYDATCVLLPLIKKLEIFEYDISDISIVYRNDLFIRTLNQRFIISESAIKEILRIKDTDTDVFYEILPVLVTHPECKSIIDEVNKELKDMSMIERDQKWSMHFTNGRYDTPQTELIKLSIWAASITRKSACMMSDIVLYQTACVMIWGFSCPYRSLRDIATKAVINLLQDKPQVLECIIDFFDDVNDPYIQQRLYAVVHGCVFRGDCCTSAALGKKVFNTVFNVDAVRPDILLRDYARCAIDYINQHTTLDDIDITKINPPYRVRFAFSQCPDRNTVEKKYRINKSMGLSQATVNTQNRILDSMETEYSNGVCGYGDFGRYTFESYLHNWKDCDGYSAPLLRNYALDLIFEKYGFDANIYQDHDNVNKCHDRNRPEIERFGKKFQWIALYEILGLLQDNYRMESSVSNDKYVRCNGTWDPFVRDIDTTNTYANYFDDDNSVPRQESLKWTHINNIPFDIKHPDKWLTNKEGMSNELVGNSILVKDNHGEEWIVLYGYNTMSPKSLTLQVDEEEIGLWEFIQAYVVPREQRNDVAKLIYRKGTQGRNMPEYRNDIYYLYYKDYYNSVSYRGYAKRTKIDDWEDFGSNNTTYQIGYIPCSCAGAMSIYRLNKLLFEILKLEDGESEGEYVDDSGKIIAFDPSVKYQNTGQLLVRKKELLSALKINGLSIVWPILFEKQEGTKIIGWQFGGYAYLTDKGRIKVKMRLYEEPRHNHNRHLRNFMWKNYAKVIWYTVSFKKTQKVMIQDEIKQAKLFSKRKNID